MKVVSTSNLTDVQRILLNTLKKVDDKTITTQEARSIALIAEAYISSVKAEAIVLRLVEDSRSINLSIAA